MVIEHPRAHVDRFTWKPIAMALLLALLQIALPIAERMLSSPSSLANCDEDAFCIPIALILDAVILVLAIPFYLAVFVTSVISANAGLRVALSYVAAPVAYFGTIGLAIAVRLAAS